MAETYLTEQEIYGIDNLTISSITGYLSSLPNGKRELVSHIFEKNHTINVMNILAEENLAYIEKLKGVLIDNGIQP
jgi:hypothetical protein